MPIHKKRVPAAAALSVFSALVAPATIAEVEDPLAPLLIEAGYTEIDVQKLPTGHETVKVTLNGQTGTFVVDSGAGATVIHEKKVVKYGLATAASEKAGAGAGGQLAVSQAGIDGITVGDLNLSMKIIHVMDLSHVVDALSAATATEVDGVVGQDVLTQYGGIIDVRGGRLFLQAPSEN